MIASAQTLWKLHPIKNMQDRTVFEGMTYGMGPAGYDIRLAQSIEIGPKGFQLASAMEEFDMPNSLLGIVHDKSTLARMGLSVFNTVIEPGWRGFLTLELKNQSNNRLVFKSGTPIAQIIFHWLDAPTDRPYNGKYQDQAAGPQRSKLEVTPPMNGYLCSECNTPQFDTPHGATCQKGHGGVEGICYNLELDETKR